MLCRRGFELDSSYSPQILLRVSASLRVVALAEASGREHKPAAPGSAVPHVPSHVQIRLQRRDSDAHTPAVEGVQHSHARRLRRLHLLPAQNSPPVLRDSGGSRAGIFFRYAVGTHIFIGCARRTRMKTASKSSPRSSRPSALGAPWHGWWG